MSSQDPVPVLVVRRGPLSARALGALEHDPRVELFIADELTPEWLSLARRVAAIVVVTEHDPLHALGYVVTAEAGCPIVVAMSRRHSAEAQDLVAAGAAAAVVTPLTTRDIDRLIPIIATHAPAARMDGTLRLLLDPISHVVRYRNKVARLSPREFAILHCLSEQRGGPVAAESIMTFVWGDAAVESRKILEVYIFQLRKKLRTLGLGNAIATVRGFGYCLAAGADADLPLAQPPVFVPAAPSS